jgi:hypothetical protein
MLSPVNLLFLYIDLSGSLHQFGTFDFYSLQRTFKLHVLITIITINGRGNMGLQDLWWFIDSYSIEVISIFVKHFESVEVAALVASSVRCSCILQE